MIGICKCGNYNSIDSKKCLKCGEKNSWLHEEIFCKGCGSPLILSSGYDKEDIPEEFDGYYLKWAICKNCGLEN